MRPAADYAEAMRRPHNITEQRRCNATWERTGPRHGLRIVLSLLVLTLAGCHRNPKVVAVVAPPPPPLETVDVPPPSHPTEPLPEEPVIASPDLPLTVPPVRRPQPPRRRPAPAPPTQTAAATPAPAPMDLGNLTTGGESTNTALLQQTDDLLKAQTRRLNAIPTATIALHTQQVEQARLFLKQASDAWAKQDIEGARTLATKAKVLLDEVTQ